MPTPTPGDEKTRSRAHSAKHTSLCRPADVLFLENGLRVSRSGRALLHPEIMISAVFERDRATAKGSSNAGDLAMSEPTQVGSKSASAIHGGAARR